MKKQIHLKERGQALVIIAISAVALFAFASLAIDGSTVYSDRRHAQNAADTSALAAALAKVRGDDWTAVGLARASSNAYDNNGTTNFVNVYDPPIDGPYQGNADYIQVKITSIVKTSLARVIGVTTLTNHVEAVARATKPEVTNWFDGKALVSTMQGCKPSGYPYDPFTIGGNSLTVVSGSGVFVNSNCSNAFTENGASSSTVASDGGICVVGGASYNPSTLDPDPSTNCGSPIDPNKYQLINPTCGTDGAITEISKGNYVASPGNYYQTFPKASPAGTLVMDKGIYCFHNGISLQGTWNLTDSGGVLLVIDGGDVTFNGSSYVDLHAIDSTAGNFPADYVNYLIYVPPTNQCTLTITGSDGSNFTGTILAPACHVKLNGSGGVLGVNSQVIGYSVAIGGSGQLNLTFNQSQNAMTTTNPTLTQSQ